MYVWTYVQMHAMYMGALPEPVSKILLQARTGCWIQQKRTYSCEPPSVCWELNHGFLEEQPVLLTLCHFSLLQSDGLLNLGINVCILCITNWMLCNVVLQFTYNEQLKLVTQVCQPLAVVFGLQEIQVIEKLTNGYCDEDNCRQDILQKKTASTSNTETNQAPSQPIRQRLGYK